MHTTEINETIFIHNGDYSGHVIIKVTDAEIEIPFADLAEFVRNAPDNAASGKFVSRLE